MATQVIWGTLAKVTGGLSGTAPEIFVGSSDQTLGVITTAGAVADLYAAGILKLGDILFINYDQDGTPGQTIVTVTATSSGSLAAYPTAVGGALLAANNLSDVANASTSRTNLGLAIGTNVQAFNAALLSIAGLTTAADKMIYTTASNVYAVADLSSFARTVLDDTTGAAMLTTLGVKRGTTAAYAGGGTSNAFTATGLAATDIVVATILASTNSVSITKAVPTSNTLTVTFSADPGAATTVQWHALPA